MSFDFDSLLTSDSLDAFKGAKSEGGIYYRPNTKNGNNGVYKSVVRFVPWYKNKQKSIIQKWTAWLVDPSTGSGQLVDCPSSIGKSSVLYQMWKKLRDSEDVTMKAQAEKFSRKLSCYALVQVIKDDNAPELVGKIMIYKFGKKIKDKIESEINPEIGSPRDPFNLLTGRRFVLHLTKSGDWDDVSGCKFDGDSYPYLHIDGEKVSIEEAMQDKEKKKEIADWLEKNSPNLEDNGYKDWDDETHDLVNRLIQSVESGSINPAKIIEDAFDEINTSSKRTEPRQKKAQSQKVTSVYDILDDDIPAPSSSSKKKLDPIDDMGLDSYDDLD